MCGDRGFYAPVPLFYNKLEAKEAYAGVLQFARSVGEPASCGPTQPDILGPYYVPDAPVYISVDTSYVMSGQVLSVRM